MKRPFHLWILFCLCLLLILPSMVWLTMTAIELDQKIKEDRHQTELARREAELQEKITSALYRMDWKLGPHIAREAARPSYLYESFYVYPSLLNVSSNGQNFGQNNPSHQKLPSPLLYQDSEFVQLHFQITANGNYTSPQRPLGKENQQMAMACCGVTTQTIEQRDDQIQQAQDFCSYDLLNERLQSTEFEFLNKDQSQQTVYVQTQAENFVAKYGKQIEQNKVPEQTSAEIVYDSKSKLQSLRAADRGGKEFLQRQKSYNTNTIQWADNNRGLGNTLLIPQQAQSKQVVEGVMRPIWIGEELVLARRTQVNGENVLQCCWLNWEKIQSALREEVKDILPDVNFEPVVDDQKLVPGRALVTLPAQVVVDVPRMLASLSLGTSELPERTLSGLQVALWVAWLGLALSAIAVGLLLYGVIRLSERRASFVSAVTHELRTPLTTFKMYSEMLADKMVPPEKQARYVKTLSIQADRLSHLVENVLQFARLERGSGNNRTEVMRVSELMDRVCERLQERANQAGMEIKYAFGDDILEQEMDVELHSLEQIIFNLVDNACKYAGKSENPTIAIGVKKSGSNIDFRIRDFGPGIEDAYRKRLFQPFCKSDLEAANSAPGVGLGLALCRRMARSMGGQLEYQAGSPGACFLLQIPV